MEYKGWTKHNTSPRSLPHPSLQNASSPKSYNRDDLLRSTHLLPSPVLSPKQADHHQHLKAANASGGAGLDQIRPDSRHSSRQAGTSTALDIRKEVAWKAHKSKQRQSNNCSRPRDLSSCTPLSTLCMQYKQQAFRPLTACSSLQTSHPPYSFLLLEAHPPPLVCSWMGATRPTTFCVTQRIPLNCSIPTQTTLFTRTNISLQLSVAPFSSPN